MQNFTYSNINENKLWLEETLKDFDSKKKIKIENYNDFFRKIKKLLLFGDFNDKYHSLILVDKALSHYFKNQTTEFDFIPGFNGIIEEIIPFIGESVINILN